MTGADGTVVGSIPDSGASGATPASPERNTIIMKKNDRLTHTTVRTTKMRNGMTRHMVTGLSTYPVLAVVNHRDGTKTVTLGKATK